MDSSLPDITRGRYEKNEFYTDFPQGDTGQTTMLEREILSAVYNKGVLTTTIIIPFYCGYQSLRAYYYV